MGTNTKRLSLALIRALLSLLGHLPLSLSVFSAVGLIRALATEDTSPEAMELIQFTVGRCPSEGPPSVCTTLQ